MEKIKLFRDAVIGYIVTQENGAYGSRYVNVTPIIGDHDLGEEYALQPLLPDGPQVLGVLPAQQNTFRVSGCLEDANIDGSVTEFGYEFAGADNPDWEDDYRERVYTNAITRKLLKIIADISSEHGEASKELILAAAMNIPLFKGWRAYDVLDGEARLQDLLKSMMLEGELDSPREGVYILIPLQEFDCCLID